MSNPNEDRSPQPQDDSTDAGGRSGAAGGNPQRPGRGADQDGKPQQGQPQRGGTGQQQDEGDISKSDDSDMAGDSNKGRTPGREQG
jgi:hypothetical protein